MTTAQTGGSKPEASKRLILLAQFAFLPTGILNTILGPMLPHMIARWSLTDAQAGNLFLVQFLSALIGVQLSGVLLSRLGYRPAFLGSLLCMAVGAATLWLGSVSIGFVSVAIYGFGVGLIVPTDSLLVAEVSPPASRTSAINLLNFFWGLGAVLCSLLVTWSAAHNLIPVFLGAVAVLLFLLAVALRAFPLPAAERSSEHKVQWRTLARNPVIWLFALVFFLYPGAETAVGGWVGSYVSRLGPRGASMASMMPAFFWAALTLGRALGTALLRGISELPVLRAGFAAASLGIGLMLWAPSLTIVIVGALLTGLSYATLYPITISRLSHRFGIAARSIGAVMFSLASLGPAVIPWLVGVTSQATGSLRSGLLLPFAATILLLLVHLREW